MPLSDLTFCFCRITQRQTHIYHLLFCLSVCLSVCLSPTKCYIRSTRHTLPTSTYYATETHQAHLIRLEYDFVESGFLVSGPSHNVLVITGDVTAQDWWRLLWLHTPHTQTCKHVNIHVMASHYYHPIDTSTWQQEFGTPISFTDRSRSIYLSNLHRRGLAKSATWECGQQLIINHLSPLTIGMSEFCNSARTELANVCRINKWHRNCKILQIILSNIALSSAPTDATASAKHFGVKVINYFAAMCTNAAVTGVTISNCSKF